jgi:DNA-binding NtrC family response regulator
MSVRILITDDDAVSCRLFAKVLEGEGYQVEWMQSGEEALTHLRYHGHDLLVVDVQMPGMSGLDVTREVRTEYPSLPVVVMTAFGSMETAFEAIREGAFDYISKPMNLEELKHTVSRALAQRALRGQPEETGEASESHEEPGAIIGRSPAMVEVYKIVARVAPTKSTVLILGERACSLLTTMKPSASFWGRSSNATG